LTGDWPVGVGDRKIDRQTNGKTRDKQTKGQRDEHTDRQTNRPEEAFLILLTGD
jgi:hypothetical protein